MDIHINIFDFSINLTPWHPSMKQKYLSVQGYLFIFKSKENTKESEFNFKLKALFIFMTRTPLSWRQWSFWAGTRECEKEIHALQKDWQLIPLKKEAWPWNQETIQHICVVHFESMKDMRYQISSKKNVLFFYLIKSSIIIIVVLLFFGHCSGRMLCKLCSVITDDNKITYYDLFFYLLLLFYFAFFLSFNEYISQLSDQLISLLQTATAAETTTTTKRYRNLNI